MLLKTERLTIRPIETGDWSGVKEIWVFQKSANSQYDRPHPVADETVRRKIAGWAVANDGREHIFFAVCLADTVIGYCAFHKGPEAYELGYCFHSGYHGKGYAKESLKALFAHLSTLGITRFRAGTAQRNTPSVALLRSLGFRLIGTEPVSFHRDAQGQDLVFEGGIFELQTTHNFHADAKIPPHDFHAAAFLSALPIFPASHPASIFSERELNFCVRDGNR